RGRFPAIGAALAAGILALLLMGPQLFPLLEAIPHSAEYRARRQALERGAGRQSVPIPEAARRMLPDLLPFAHGIYGKSPVQIGRGDGSGMPLGYAGAVLFPLAALGLFRRPPHERGRAIFLGLFVAGLLFGASAPGVHDLMSRLPGFALALNYRLVFLAGLGLSGLAAFGAAHLHLTDEPAAGRRLVFASGAVGLALVAGFQFAQPVFVDRSLPDSFTWTQFLYEAVPVALLGLGALVLPARARVPAALVLLCGQRFLEMRGVYPTLPAPSLAPPLPGLEAARSDTPSRVVAAGTIFRPNGAALYGLEDVRGYESLVLDRFAETYPMWCRAQPASFNLVTDLGSPFLSLLNARFAIGAPADRTPKGWIERTRNSTLTIFENPRALPRAFVPRRLRFGADASRRLEEMAGETDFGGRAWLSRPASAGEAADVENGEAALELRSVGPDLLIAADVSKPAFIATTLPDWPGWRAEADGGSPALRIETVNHAFVGMWLPAGKHRVRLTYRPPSFALGLGALAAGLVCAAVLAATARPRPS
ncbi:MAG: YfhO family protein, partial [Thermoanaerobaculia bacterium]